MAKRINNLLKGLIIVIFNTLFGSCSSRRGIEPVTANRSENTLYNGHIQLLGVRSAEEYAQGHIINAKNIDVQQPDLIKEAQAKLDHTNPVYIYCRSGRHSMLVVQKLAEAGFKVINLCDGIVGWEDAGKPAFPQRGQVLDEMNVILDEELHSSCKVISPWLFSNCPTM